MNKCLKLILSVIAGSAASFFGQYGLLVLLVSAAVVLDVITGIVKVKATGEGLSSRKAAKGFWKKMALFGALAFGIFLDAAAGAVLVSVGVNFAGEPPFALIVCSYIILNESISIAENLYIANPDSFPRRIAQRLMVAREGLEKESKGTPEQQDSNIAPPRPVDSAATLGKPDL